MSLIGALTQAAGKTAKKTAPFYSAVDEALANLKRPKGTGAEFFTELSKQAGVKKAELADRKLEQAFKAKGKMTKEEAQQVLKDNPPPQVNERQLAEISDAERDEALRDNMERFGYRSWDEVPSRVMRKWNDEIDEDLEKFGDYRTPIGENYREILLRLPKSDTSNGDKNYWSTHFLQDPNVLAHMRVQDQVGPNGEKILHIEEIQSDWHQTGRKKGYKPDNYIEQSNALEQEFRDLVNKRGQLRDEAERIGYRGEGHKALVEQANSITPRLMQLQEQRDSLQNVINYGVPDAPFKKNWHELAMKRLLNYAVDNGYDSIAITPGAEQAKRYSLAKQLDEVQFDPNTGYLAGRDHNGKLVVAQKGVTAENLEDYIGKEGAQKILQTPVDEVGQHTLRGADLEVGGEGMKGFYDKMLPDYLNTYGKSYGSQVQMESIPISTRDPQSTSWGGGQGEHPFITVQDLNEPFEGMVELIRRNADTGEETLVGRMTRPESERRMAQELQKLDTVNQVKLHNFPITPEMRESIKQKGLPLYQQIGIPTAGAGAASQALQPEEESGLATGGIVKSAVKQAQLAKLAKMRQEMAPRAEAVKALIARDENRYLSDVVPNSLTNPEIEAEIKRMAAKAPMIMKPSALTELRKIVEQEKGGYGSRRLERAADEIPNLEKLYSERALREAFTGDNARALMTMNPADFEKFAMPLVVKTDQYLSTPVLNSRIKARTADKLDMPTDEYVKYLMDIDRFDDVPFLTINKEEQGLPLMPFISGHEGRHRNRSLASRGEQAGLVQLLPRAELREPFPRRSQEQYIEALKQELEMTGNKVEPEKYRLDLGGYDSDFIRRPPIKLPDIYAKGGAVKPKVKDSKSGRVRMTENRDTMFMELSNKKLKRK